MTFTEAAAEVLRSAGKPLHYKEITELAIEKNLLSHVGKSPEVTMGARLAALLKKEDKTNPIVRVKPGVFALREWDGKKAKKGAAEEAPVEDAPESEGGINALEVEAVTRDSNAPPARSSSYNALPGNDDDDDRPILSGDDAHRADLAAQGADLFEDEDDDDQPIFGTPATQAAAQPGAAAANGEAGDGRRRRRRRRRGRGGEAGRGGELEQRSSQPRLNDGQIQPNPIISVDGEPGAAPGPAGEGRDPLAPPPRPQIRDRYQIMGGAAPANIDGPLGDGDELAGKDLADAALMVLGAFDRNGGPAQMRQVVDALVRRGRLSGDPAVASAQLGASLRADNLRRQAQGIRPRFRFANGGRVALTDWSLGGDLGRLEQEVWMAVERYREASRRAMLRKLQELPGHALVELVLLGLERIGMNQVKPVKRAGSPGGEAHFQAVRRTEGTSEEIRTAIIVRKDGREIGRERVSDLRGALHHYGPATAGWLITTGQVLSGAREEASALQAAPVALFDGVGVARLLEENDVGVIRTRFPIAIPDLELLETLRGL
ncbi:MAG: HTH domain-containing protein [Polyangiaceae bacterium]